MTKTDTEILHELRLIKKYKRGLYVEELMNNSFITVTGVDEHKIRIRVSEIAILEDIGVDGAGCGIGFTGCKNGLEIKETAEQVINKIQTLRKRLTEDNTKNLE